MAQVDANMAFEKLLDRAAIDYRANLRETVLLQAQVAQLMAEASDLREKMVQGQGEL